MKYEKWSNSACSRATFLLGGLLLEMYTPACLLFKESDLQFVGGYCGIRIRWEGDSNNTWS